MSTTSETKSSKSNVRVIHGPKALARVVKSAKGTWIANLYFGGKGKSTKKLVTPLGGIDLAAMKTESPFEAVRKACFIGRIALKPNLPKSDAPVAEAAAA
jgi:hypothetical protein